LYLNVYLVVYQKNKNMIENYTPQPDQNTPQNGSHDFSMDLAKGWRKHVAEDPALVEHINSLEVPTQSEGLENTPRLQERLTNQALFRAASVIRHAAASTDIDMELVESAAYRVLGLDPNPYPKWYAESDEGKAHDVLTSPESSIEFRAPLPDKILGVEKDLHDTEKTILKILWSSGRKGGLNETELAFLEGWKQRKKDLGGVYLEDLYNRLRVGIGDDPNAIPKFQRSVERNIAQSRLLKRELAEQDGIYHLPSTDALVRKMMPQVAGGRHVLMYGMPGIAKSRIALYLGTMSNEFSGHPEKQVYECMIKEDTPTGDIFGRWTNLGVYQLGPVLQALKEDTVVSVEEFNNADHDVQSMFQRVALLKVGEKFTVQQGDRSEVFTRGPGFCIIASANPNTKGMNRFELDTAMRERFTGGVFENLYPDSEVSLGDDLEEIPDFVETILVDKETLKRKLPNKNWSDDDVDALIKISNWTQYLATHAGNDPSLSSNQGMQTALDPRLMASEKYPLTKLVLSPRQIEQCIRRAQADPELTLVDALVQFANAPDLRSLKAEQKTFASMMVNCMLVTSDQANNLFRV
jgi:MoxR-like ATPase